MALYIYVRMVVRVSAAAEQYNNYEQPSPINFAICINNWGDSYITVLNVCILLWYYHHILYIVCSSNLANCKFTLVRFAVPSYHIAMKTDPSINQGQFIVNQSQLNNVRSSKKKHRCRHAAQTIVLAAKA